MRRNNKSLRNSGTYTSPSTPEYGDNYVNGFQRGWCSERVPLPNNSSRRHITATALMPFNSGRALPSKWDDAERWITSPVSSYGIPKTSNVQLQEQPKSKSGPLGAPGVLYIPNSPSSPAQEVESISNFVANSPFTTGVLVPDGLSIHYGPGTGTISSALYAETSMARASTAPGLSDFFAGASLRSSQDDKLDGTKEPDDISFVVSRRDMATQMSPDGSTYSSPERRSTSVLSEEKPYNERSTKVEIRDVQVDSGAPVAGPNQNNGVRPKTMKELQAESKSRWDAADAARSISKQQREEARITAWENLQKAKAEAAIQKLEVKLAKRRSSSMDKIMNKLRRSQLKAQAMRRAISEGQTQRSSKKLLPLQKFFKSFSSCFSCHVH